MFHTVGMAVFCRYYLTPFDPCWYILVVKATSYVTNLLHEYRCNADRMYILHMSDKFLLSVRA